MFLFRIIVLYDLASGSVADTTSLTDERT